MGATYYTPPAPRRGQSVFIATPAYEGTKPGYSYSLALSTAELVRQGIPFELGIMEGNCHVDDGRNSLVRRFMEGNCTDMLFIDADLMWDADAVLRILSWDEDLVAGAYPFKSMSGDYPVGRIFHARSNGLLEVSYAPTGFMRIRRNVLDTLYPLQSRHGVEHPTAVFFERRFNGKTRDGGDVTFCRKWIATGGKVLVDPSIKFSHIGEWRFTGRFSDWLANPDNAKKHIDAKADASAMLPPEGPYLREEKFVPDDADTIAALKRIVAGDDSEEAFKALAVAWNNEPWQAPVSFLKLAYDMAKNLPEDARILECGSGISTACLAASGRKLMVIEENTAWAERAYRVMQGAGLDADVLVAPIDKKTSWYSAAEKVHGLHAQLVVIDGPRRTGPNGERRNRGWPITDEAIAAGVVTPKAAVLIDDVAAVDGKGSWVRMGTEQRPYCAGRLGVEDPPAPELLPIKEPIKVHV